ncbi:TPA: hypothetical protein ACPY7G_003492 [Morganella morganii]
MLRVTRASPELISSVSNAGVAVQANSFHHPVFRDLFGHMVIIT